MFYTNRFRTEFDQLRRTFSDLQIIDLQGGYVIPGFTDSHIHLLAHGIESQRISLETCRTLDECLQKLSAEKDREIIFGVNWDESSWVKGSREDLNRQLLDRLSKDKPVVMRRICGHFAVCNTSALNSISREWKTVDRKNGWLIEDAALYLNRIFKPSFEMYKKGLALAMKEAISLGITSINEITDITGFGIYKKLKKNLGLRVALYLQENLKSAIDMGLKSNSGDDFLKFSGVKLYMDGSIGALTAAMKKPYQQSRNRGQTLISEKQLLSIVNLAESHSIQLMIHSIGDRATELVLKIMGSKKLEGNPLRHRLEHLELLDTNHIKAISKQHLIASMQPNFLRWQSLDNMYYKNLGMRYKRMNCFKKMKMAGVKLVFGSDCMPIGPLYGISLAVNHPDGAVRLLPAEAIELYTEAPPYATFDENKKGKIREGYLADIVVFNKNPLVKQNLQTIKIIKVFIDGKPVDEIEE